MVSFILRWTGSIFGFSGSLPSPGNSWPSPKASWRLGGNSVWHHPKIVDIALPRRPFCVQFLEDRGQRAASKAIPSAISRRSWPSLRLGDNSVFNFSGIVAIAPPAWRGGAKPTPSRSPSHHVRLAPPATAPGSSRGMRGGASPAPSRAPPPTT